MDSQLRHRNKFLAFFRNLPAVGKFMVTAGVLCAIMVAISFLGIQGNSSQHKHLEEMYEKSVLQMRKLGDTETNYQNLRRVAYQLLLADTQEQKQHF